MASVALIKVQRDFCLRYIGTFKVLIEQASNDSTKVQDVRTELERLSERVSTFETCQSQLIALSKDEDKDNLFKIYDDFCTDVRNIKRVCETPPFKEAESHEPVSFLNAGFSLSNNATSQFSSHTRLPKLDLPRFSGHISEWLSYYDMFISSVDNNETLTPVLKFQYLKATLTGEALSLVKNIPLTDANYDVALGILKERYDRQRLISAYHLQSIFDLPPLKSTSHQAVGQFISAINEHVAALRAQGEPVDAWSRVLALLLVNKLETRDRDKFERNLDQHQLPELDTLLSFLNKYISAQQWQTISCVNKTPQVSTRSRSYSSRGSSFKTNTFVTRNNTTVKCTLCDNPHVLSRCFKFQKLSPQDRFNLVKKHNNCYNCLSSEHRLDACKSTFSCKTCNLRHHSLLHLNGSQKTQSLPSDKADNHHVKDMRISKSENSNVPTTSCNNLTRKPAPVSLVLLGTVRVMVADANNRWHSVRALLDSGSESTFITEDCRHRLQIPLTQTNTVVSGFSNFEVDVTGTVSCHIRPTCSSHPTFSVNALVISQITRNLPKQHISLDECQQFQSLRLADPEFNVPGIVDMLIGADIYFSLLTGRILGQSGELRAIETRLGWVISGPLKLPSEESVDVFLTTRSEVLSESLKRFWEIEEVPMPHPLSKDEEQAELQFVTQHFRTDSGRYVVPLLFRNFPPNLGTSYSAALACFKSLQFRLNKNESLRQQYSAFMRDYLDEGHMSLIPPEHNTNDGYYLPHHCVLKENSSTTKLRVVFNASKKTSSGNSLNDELLIGPSLQQDLATIVTRARLHRIFISADIRQMYRQILVPSEQRQFQRILWCDRELGPPDTYQLNTVTYGTSCAPFLAIRTLQQLVLDEGAQFPEAALTLTNDTFVDDIITGSHSVETALHLHRQLVELLSKAGLELRKWTSNDPEILANIPDAHKEPALLSFSSGESIAVKILGLIWNPVSDEFSYKINLIHKQCTKRSMLSEIARIFDPLGWLTPTTMFAKTILQELWKLTLDWDEEPPLWILTKWSTFRSQLPLLANVSLPRFVDIYDSHVTLCGFCDASEVGYAAVVYLRFTAHGKAPGTTLLSAKSRVAPLKRISIPRLELCAALLLSRLIAHTSSILGDRINDMYAWSDSTVTLAWIRSPPYRWKTFVSNRVAEIQGNTDQNIWHHVKSQDNPADCASRGVLPTNLVEHKLWWQGPEWLHQSISEWSLTSSCENEQRPEEIFGEERPTVSLVAQIHNDFSLLDRFSSLDKLLRITAWCYRFLNQSRKHPIPKTSYLTAKELDAALLRWVTLVQNEAFSEDINRLKEGRLCSVKLQRLCPFLDDTGLLRVGGRLSHAKILYDQKHPLVLPAKHLLTGLIVNQFHLRYLHPSPRTLQAILAQRFWILSARKVVRSVTSKCIRCFRCKPFNQNPIMGDLPEQRVTPLKAFSIVGVDYGGPFFITPHKGRGFRSVKAYLCLFICFSTKAVHLELASDLSTDVFLAAFRRLLSRRGRCSRVHSDSGTNFIGAKRYFSELQKFIVSTEYNQFLANHLAADGIEWDLNPPSGPHFGGLWEAAIKSVKFHLTRIIGQQVLTYEEFNTILCQVESILNSRPLSTLSNDPNDLQALTPNHFLTLESAVGLPERNLIDTPLNHLTRWQLVQRVVQDFWKRWHTEYLNSLQCRSKWTKPARTIVEGDLVLIKDNNLPPLQWRLGRITKVFPGKDNVVRVAEVKTANSIFIRPVVKLFPLPL